MPLLTKAAALAAFNLVCTGTTTVGSVTNGPSREGQSSFALVYRIDLVSKRWCVGKCDSTNPIFSIDDTTIILDYRQNDAKTSEKIIGLGREDGSLTYADREDDIMITGQGKCERAPFAGFPAKKF